MSFVFLDVGSVKALHEQLIRRFGGAAGVRDEGLLQSAVLRAKIKVLYEPQASVGAVGASLAWALIKNHAFLDGNKRIGLASLVVFLDLNGYKLESSEAQQITMVLRVAASEMTEDQWTEWVEPATVCR